MTRQLGHPGAAASEVAAEDALDLDLPANPVAPDPAPVVARHARSVHRYPETETARLALAGAIGVDPDDLVLTNGAAAAFALVSAELAIGHHDDGDQSFGRPDLVSTEPTARGWRPNPDNLSGRLLPADETAAVLGEAFYPLAAGEWTRGDHHRGAVVIGSLSSLLACPGLRVGYVLTADPELRARLVARQGGWSVGSPACAAVPELLEVVDLPRWRDRVAALRADLVHLLEGFGLEVEPSDACYVLVQRMPGLRDLFAPQGVTVRDCTGFGMPDATRIAVPDGAGLERLDSALRGATAILLGRGPIGLRSSSPTAPTFKRTRASAGLPAPPRGAIMVCGTASDAGKSQIVTGLCRLLHRRGVRVAPFKAENMSLNSYATASGHEIGRAQALQAMAAGVEPEISMNPVLLKPSGDDRSQVVVLGRAVADLDYPAYRERRDELRRLVVDAYSDLAARFDVVVLEGTGGAAEVNLLEGELSNLGLAAELGVPAIVAGDIERGGVFAALFGTVELVPPALRRQVGGFVINKMRGHPALLATGVSELERRTGIPVLGVLPYASGLDLDAEDSLALARLGVTAVPAAGERQGDTLDVAVVCLPAIANFTDLDGLRIEPAVSVRLVASAARLGDPDLILLPGSKTTVADLEWLRECGLAEALTAAAERPGGPVILGLCGGYQMLGRRILDDGVESGAGVVSGLGLLPVETVLVAEKITRRRSGAALGCPFAGYEIHHGRTTVDYGATTWLSLDDPIGREPEGARSGDGRVYGTSLHGLFENDRLRSSFLAAVASARGKRFTASGASFVRAREEQIDTFADLIESNLDVEAVWSLLELSRR